MALQMDARANEARYQFDRVQRALHWTMAALILLAIALGGMGRYLPAGHQPRQGLLEVHKSLGFTILVLLVVRVTWRLVAGEPPYRAPLGRLNHLASRAGHFALYGLMLVMPISGYLYSAAGGYSLPWFGLFQWPRLLPHDKDISEWGKLLHYWGAWIIAAVLAVHLAAVVWHHWIKRDEVLSRMTG
ncbi:cytochrome b [Bradyrhizobium sp.]|uniref:cytochrome b n=1 Tax=Bradyrhizobium sp. TaxID=376 RepID=UPI003C3788C7